MISAFHHWRENRRLKRELDAVLAQRKAARAIRSEAGHQAQHTYWQRAGERHRELFGMTIHQPPPA